MPLPSCKAVLLALGGLFPLALSLAAQADSVRLTNRYRFNDGLYLDHASLLADRPDIPWEEVDAQLVVNNTTFQARLGQIRRKSGGRAIPTAAIYGFSRDGVPYLRAPKPDDGSDADAGAASETAIARFSGLQFTGRIAYFGYPDDSTRMVTITAYNPLTGTPFREGKVPRKEEFFREFILHMPSGAIAPLTWPRLRAWIRDDAGLMQQIRRLKVESLDLIRVLQTYDDRNPMFIHPEG